MHRLACALAALLSVCILFAPGAVPAAQSARLSASNLQLFAEPGAGSGPVLALIRSARHSIRLEVYLLTNQSVISALGSAHRRGVNVRVLLEEHPFGADTYARRGYQDLQQIHVPVRWAHESAFTYTHEKAMDVDGRVAGIFTFNLSTSGLYTNREFGVMDRSARDARAIGAVFNADWTRSTPHLSDPRLVVSPVNSRFDLDRLIGGARHRIDLYEEEVADTGVDGQLEAAARRHVRVRLITSQDSAGVTALRRGGVSVRIMPTPYVHAKAIVVDGSRWFIGSENLSSTSLDRNREMGIIARSTSLAKVIERTFAVDWGTGTAPASPSYTSVTGDSGTLAVHVSVQPSVIAKGQLLTVAASTRAGSRCTIRVTYPDGYVSRTASLRTVRVADRNGQASWSYHVYSTVTGIAHASVSCTSGSDTGTGTTTFRID